MQIENHFSTVEALGSIEKNLKTSNLEACFIYICLHREKNAQTTANFISVKTKTNNPPMYFETIPFLYNTLPTHRREPRCSVIL